MLSAAGAAYVRTAVRGAVRRTAAKAGRAILEDIILGKVSSSIESQSMQIHVRSGEWSTLSFCTFG